MSELKRSLGDLKSTLASSAASWEVPMETRELGKRLSAMREPTLLFGTLRPDLTGAVSPLWKGLEPPGAGPDRPSSPAAREQCSWFLHLLVGR